MNSCSCDTTYASFFNRQPYDLNSYQPGCGIRRREPENNSTNQNSISCNEFNQINFHRKCSCYLKMNIQNQCQCGMIPSLFHKLLSAPYTALSDSFSHSSAKQQKKQKKCKGKCKCKCRARKNQPIKQNILPPQQIYIQPQQIITYTRPHISYNPQPIIEKVVQPNVSFKSIPATSIKTVPHPSLKPPYDLNTGFVLKQNSIKQVPTVKEPDIVRFNVESDGNEYITPKLPSKPVVAAEPKKVFPQTISETSIRKQQSIPSKRNVVQQLEPAKIIDNKPLPAIPINQNNMMSVFGQNFQITPQGAQMSMFRQQMGSKVMAHASQNSQSIRTLTTNSYQQVKSSVSNKIQEKKQIIVNQYQETDSEDDQSDQNGSQDQAD